MQLKLLNIHKLLANIATNLVGAFIPVIIYEATQSIVWAVFSYLLQYLVRIGCVWIFRKPFEQKPQLMLLFRMIPLFLYSIFVIIIDANLWVGIVGVILFSGISEGFKRMPTEFILNYSSLEDSESSLGFTRLVEQIGYMLSLLVGGYLLNVNKIFVVILSMVIYAISVVPLLVYYLKLKKQKTFNKDAVSNAMLKFKADNKEKYDYGKVLSKKMLIIYGITYFVFCFIDGFSTLFNVHLFAINGSYAVAGIFNAIYNGAFGVGSWIIGKISEKKDIQTIVIVTSVASALCIVGIILINIVWVQYILFGILGIASAPTSFFCFQRLITKSRILGNSNQCLVVREQASNLSIVVSCLPVLFGSVVPCFVLIAVAVFASAIITPYHEEKSRRLLVDYLQFNEIKSHSRSRRIKQ